MPKPAIYDITTLDAEIKRLKKKVHELEDQFNESADELKDNYGSMAFNSFVGNNIRKIPLLGAFLYPWLTNPAIQENIQRFSENMLEKASDFLQKWFSSIFEKK